MLERLVKIAHLPQLFLDVALLDFFGKALSVFDEVSPALSASNIVSAASIPLFIAR